MKSILYINRKDAEKVMKVKGFCLIHHIRIEKETEDPELPEDAEIMRFAGMSNAEVGEMITRLRAMGIVVPLKCVETETNRDWPLSRLYKELSEEHEYMKNQNRPKD